MDQLIRLVREREPVEATAIAIQQIPAPTFGEQRRSAEVLRRFQAIGLSDVAQDDLGNVYGCRPGRGTMPGLLLAAHIDTVFPEETDLTTRHEDGRIYGPGIGDNSLGVAALLHLAAAVEQAGMPNEASIWFVADVGEEGLGNLRGMRAAVDRLADRIGSVIAVEGSGFGRIYHRAIGVRRLRIDARTPGGHSWADYGAPSAVHLLAEVAAAIIRIPTTENPRTTLNIGVIEGGTSVNTIAEQAHLLLDLRSEDQAALEQLMEATRRAVDGIDVPDGATLSTSLVGHRDGGAIAEIHPLAQAAERSLRAVGAEVVWGLGSTDANVPLARGIPAVCVGITAGGNAHRLDEYIELADIPRGMEALARIVSGLVCPNW